jgi:hypothetical protein
MSDPFNREMNRRIVQGVERGQRLTTGALARLAGSQPQEGQRERLNRVLEERDTAVQRGDDTALGLIDDQLDRLVADARAAHTERPRDEQGRFVSAGDDESVDFDGGVRGRRPRPSPGMVEPTSTDLMRAAFMASRQERIEREADQTIIAGNI